MQDKITVSKYGEQLLTIIRLIIVSDNMRDKYYIYQPLMNFNVDYLRMSTPLSTQSKSNNSQQINFDYLQFRLNTILMTLQTQKEELQQKHFKQKQALQKTIIEKQNQINIIQQRYLKIEQECRQLKFNYHQRGSIIDYLKKKIQTQQEKIKNQKQQMKSIIKYLQQTNQELNLKLENAYNQIQRKIVSGTPSNYTSRNSLFCKKSSYNDDNQLQTRRIPEKRYISNQTGVIKQNKQIMHIDQKNPFQLKDFFWQDDNQNQQKQLQSQDFLDCTIKNQQKLNKINSYQTICPSKHQQFQNNDIYAFQRNHKGFTRMNTPIFINNYGHMRITDLDFGSLNNEFQFQTYRKQKSATKTPNQIYSELKNKNKKNYK